MDDEEIYDHNCAAIKHLKTDTLYYSRIKDRYFFRDAILKSTIIWVSNKRNLSYGGVGKNGWNLNQRAKQIASAITVKYGWTDNSRFDIKDLKEVFETALEVRRLSAKCAPKTIFNIKSKK